MQTYKFKNNRQDFVTELREHVKNYFEQNTIEKYGNREILVKTGLMSILYFTPFITILFVEFSSVLLLLGLFIIMGLGLAGIGLVTMHDANHGSFSKHRWVNTFFANSLYLLGGFPANWKFQHNTLHHGYTNIEGQDEDIGHGGLLRFSPHKPLKKVHRFQYIYAWFLYGLMTLLWVTSKDFTKLKKYQRMDAILSGKKDYKKLFIDLLISKIVYYGIFLGLPLILSAHPWYLIAIGFLIMHFTSGFVLSVIFQTAHVVPTSDYPLPDKNNEIQNNWSIHQLFTTCDFSPNSKVFSWLIGGLNYQVIHHLFPNISHIHYKNLSKIVRETTEKYGLPYHVNNTFMGAIIQHGKMLKLLGTAKNSYLPNVQYSV